MKTLVNPVGYIESIVDDSIGIDVKSHILLYREDEFFIAHSLEFDLAVDGLTEKQVREDIISVVIAYIDFGIEHGIYNINPAPPEYWETFYSRGD